MEALPAGSDARQRGVRARDPVQSLLARQVAQCRPVAQIDLVENIRQVCSRRSRGNAKPRADLIVAGAPPNRRCRSRAAETFAKPAGRSRGAR